MPEHPARLLLVRHGESTWNAEHRWQGHSDPPLSPLGERQARAAAGAVAALAFSAVYSSDLVRARQTADLLTPAGLAVIVDPALKERNVGAWEGFTRDEIDEQFPGMREAHESPPGFESDESVIARVEPALIALGASRGAGTATLVVTHGGVIRSLERRLGAASPAPVPNLGGRWFEATADALALGDQEVLVDPDDAALTAAEEQ